MQARNSPAAASKQNRRIAFCGGQRRVGGFASGRRSLPWRQANRAGKSRVGKRFTSAVTGGDFRVRRSLPGAFPGGAMCLTIGVEFLVGKGGTAGQWMLGSLDVQGLLQFLIAEGGRVLKGQMFFGKGAVGDGEDELAAFCLLVNHPVGVVAAMRFQLKSEILDLYDDLLSGLGVPARATARVQGAGRELGWS